MTVTADDLFIPGRAGRISVRTKGMQGAAVGDAVVLVQGANLSGQMGYDFAYEGGENYSMMDALAQAGFAVVTFSIRGYAQSELHNGDPLSVQTEEAIEDLATVVDWVASEGFALPHIAGWSWGGRIAAHYAARNANRLDRLVLLDPALGGGNLIPFDPVEPWWSNSYDYFFNRLEAEYTDLAARTAIATRAQAEEPRSPNGIRVENAKGSVAAKAAEITRPTLMLYGIAAAKQDYMQGGTQRLAFFEALPTDDKTFVIVPDGGDYIHLQHGRRRVHRDVINFLDTEL